MGNPSQLFEEIPTDAQGRRNWAEALHRLDSTGRSPPLAFDREARMKRRSGSGWPLLAWHCWSGKLLCNKPSRRGASVVRLRAGDVTSPGRAGI